MIVVQGGMQMVEKQKVEEHYRSDALMGRLQAALSDAGLMDGKLTVEQLAPLDQFHSRGLLATVELAKALSPHANERVLDIGSGLGGPSRYLAATYGCVVSGIDLSQSFVSAATYLAERAGHGEMVSYQKGDALALPFDDEKFDIAWTQHVAMNIADRTGFYSEASRVLRPGGRLAIYDVLAGGGGPIVYPVPWSKTAEGSYLLTQDEMKSSLADAGFEIISWTDRTDAALAWFQTLHKQQAAHPVAPIGLHLAMGPEFKAATANLARNLDEGRAVLIEAVAVKRRAT